MNALLQRQLSNLEFKRNQIDPHMRPVTKACNDASAHLDAKELVPLGELLQDNLDALENENHFKDNLLPLLVNWFSSDFFRWFEKPDCERCRSSLRFDRSFVNQEGKWVESYVCDIDGYEFLFVRHNEPAILLHTRTGRCGEWAMCFFVILRAMDYHARIVYDSTDHVWNEVWSETRNQFVHVDPCENTVDCPLLYEVGWQKKLEYCLAFSQYEVQDVTKRYSKDYNVTLTRRNACDEAWLAQTLNQITSELQSSITTSELKSTISERLSQDTLSLIEMSSAPRKIPDRSQLSGRKTGSLQWRITRGEYQTSAKKATVIKVGTSTAALVDSKPIFTLQYNCEKNIYKSSADEYNGVSGWSSILYEYENLDYKYEKDWKTSYIARYEGCSSEQMGKIRWRFNLSDIKDIEWHTIEILVTGKSYPNTNISAMLLGYTSENCADVSKSLALKLNEVVVTSKAELSSEIGYIDVFIELSGGFADDEVAWQKPQLFRQTRGSEQPTFSIKIF